MSGYRRVNYYELCRLCTNSEGTKMNIFLEEGRRRQLQTKIQTYLPIQVLEEDSLPKIVCLECIKKLESYIEFREAVVNAEGMLESYFTSLRFSEDFLKEGKVYVKSTKEEKPIIVEELQAEDDTLNAVEKIVPTNASTQIITDPTQPHPQQVLVNNINASNLQIISGVQARVQQYKCAMQMHSGNVAAAVVEAETHYSYQQQTSQQIQSQQNQIIEQSQTQPTQIQVQNQIQSQNQISQQQVQTLRQMSQQPSNQTSQVNQQVNQQQTHINQEQQNQTQITQQLQQLQRQQREQFEKQRHMHHIEKQQQQQHIHVNNVQEQQQVEVHRSNIILKTGDTNNQQNLQNEPQKNESVVVNQQNQQTFTTVQATPEVFLSLGFKDALSTQVTREDSKDLKDFVKNSEDAMSRTSVNHISEFLRIRSGPEQPSPLVTVNPQAITQTSQRQVACCECGKTFNSINQMNGHDCTATLLNEQVTEISSGSIKEESSTHINGLGSPFSCDVCNKPFKRKEHLFQHRKLHTGERPYVCTTCAKAFSRKEHLVRHLVSHTGQKMHECEVCGKSFSRKDNLHKHRKTHGMSGPYICETCGKSFVVKHYYLMHLTTHAPAVVDGLTCIQDPLPYKCDICHKAFSVKQYLTTHKLRHRSKSNNANHAQNNGVMQPQSQQQQQQQQQQVQQATSTNELTVTRDITSTSINSGTSHTASGSVIEIQGVVDRAEHQQQQQGGTFVSSHYQGNVSQFQ